LVVFVATDHVRLRPQHGRVGSARQIKLAVFVRLAADVDALIADAGVEVVVPRATALEIRLAG
jgi:hypothetical protein